MQPIDVAMKLIREIEKQEMLRRWAIAEVYVEYLNAIETDVPNEILALLYSGDPDMELDGISRALKEHHFSLVDCLPSDVSWYLVELEIKQSEFDQLYTLPVPDLELITNYTFRVADAAHMIQKNRVSEDRINEIKNALKLGRVQLSGITLLAKRFTGPYTIIEGNGRLISLYNLLFVEASCKMLNDHIEVVIGLSDVEFKIQLQYLD